MAAATHQIRVRAETVWLIIASIYLVVGVVVSLGEWVFHWWHQLGHLLGPLALILALPGFGWSASARDVRRLRERMVERFAHLDAELREHQEILHQLLEGQREPTGVLREVMPSFRPRAEGQG